MPKVEVNWEKVIEKVKAYEDTWEYEIVGVRIQEKEFKVGEILDNSFCWIDGEPTDEELPGTCAICNGHIASCCPDYFGDHVAIIAGNNYMYGEDPGEVIIEDAICLEIIK